MADIFLYAVDKQDLRYKGETYIVQPDPTIKAAQDHQGRPRSSTRQLEPRARRLARLAAILHNTLQIDRRDRDRQTRQRQARSATSRSPTSPAPPRSMLDDRRAGRTQSVRRRRRHAADRRRRRLRHLRHQRRNRIPAIFGEPAPKSTSSSPITRSSPPESKPPKSPTANSRRNRRHAKDPAPPRPGDQRPHRGLLQPRRPQRRPGG